ncbi:MAG: hypothetical protein M4579_005297 [Chaenotheca gracillima]|nr:MAG: hypothetical protein M4579_005297 [Chaenotheca gracillima]
MLSSAKIRGFYFAFLACLTGIIISNAGIGLAAPFTTIDTILTPDLLLRDVSPAFLFASRGGVDRRVNDDNSTVGENSLNRRGCIPSRPKDTGANPEPVPLTYVCDGNWPTLDDLKSHIQEEGNVGRLRSFFYTNLAGAGAIELAKAWARCHTEQIPEIDNGPGYVTWDEIVNLQWLRAQTEAFLSSGKNNIDPFLKLLAQAFAEESSGDVYFFTPNDQDPLGGNVYNSAWAGWEYPALTRNSAVTKIIRVDPRERQGQQEVYWTQGQPPSSQEPLGLWLGPPPPT